jgi:hypothetical protein
MSDYAIPPQTCLSSHYYERIVAQDPTRIHADLLPVANGHTPGRWEYFDHGKWLVCNWFFFLFLSFVFALSLCFEILFLVVCFLILGSCWVFFSVLLVCVCVCVYVEMFG